MQNRSVDELRLEIRNRSALLVQKIKVLKSDIKYREDRNLLVKKFEKLSLQ